jgi:acetyltransferase-like isoleucine patch superfamily enzyme
MNWGYARRHFGEFLRGVLRGHPGVRIAKGVKLNGPGTYDLHAGSYIAEGARIWVGPGATLTLDRNCKIGIRNIINVQTSVTIREGTRMSWDVQVLDTDFHWVRSARGRLLPVTLPVSIGPKVLVGTGAMILKGVEVGEGSVIAARSVVRVDVAPGTVVVGNPAKEAGTVSEWGAPPRPES